MVKSGLRREASGHVSTFLGNAYPPTGKTVKSRSDGEPAPMQLVRAMARCQWVRTDERRSLSRELQGETLSIISRLWLAREA
jgi:hypothetical protein